MVRAIDKVTQVLKDYSSKAIGLYKAQKTKKEEERINFKKEVNVVKLNFLTIVENALKEKLETEPVFSGDIKLDIMEIPDVIAEEHERTGGAVSSSKVQVLQELVDFIKNEGLDPIIHNWKWPNGKNEYSSKVSVTIPKELVEKYVWSNIEKN